MFSTPFWVVVTLAAAVGLVLWWRRDRKRKAKAKERAETVAAHRAEDPLSDDAQVAASGDPRKIKLGDVIEYLVRSFVVRGTAEFHEGRYSWKEHFVDEGDGGGAKKWLTVEDADEGLEVCLWTIIDGSGLSPRTAVVTYDGIEFIRDEWGTATYAADGQTGLEHTGRVEYFDFKALDGALLSFERFDGSGEWEVAIGELIPNGELTVYPGGTPAA
ncbi:MAG TPA: DUF4178 domain-containing protein [Candidatus Polarisedimenticolaceae bacterium]|nr:DUF4178 domain-containing protein [Candidatus Polarisedimenticolaceae bacterium]